MTNSFKVRIKKYLEQKLHAYKGGRSVRVRDSRGEWSLVLQDNTAKKALETRIGMQAIKQQVRLEGQGKVQRLL